MVQPKSKYWQDDYQKIIQNTAAYNLLCPKLEESAFDESEGPKIIWQSDSLFLLSKISRLRVL